MGKREGQCTVHRKQVAQRKDEPTLQEIHLCDSSRLDDLLLLFIRVRSSIEGLLAVRVGDDVALLLVLRRVVERGPSADTDRLHGDREC
jgi:hypothetical protein